MKILNKEQLDAWLFQHAVVMEHSTVSIKGEDGRNTHWKDVETGETIAIEYGGGNNESESGEMLQRP